MTICDQSRDLPLADATPAGPKTPEILALSARARGQRTTEPEDVTERERSPKDEATVAWDRLCCAIAYSGLFDDDQAAQAWRTVRESVDRIRGDAAVMVRALVAGIARTRMDTPSGHYSSRAEKEARRAANRAEFWAREYATKGGTPEKDAALVWSHLLADVVKADRAGLDTAGVWWFVRQSVDKIWADLEDEVRRSGDEGVPR